MMAPTTPDSLLDAICHQLRLIASTNEQIGQWSAADGESSLMVCQYRQLRKGMVQELNCLFWQLDVTLHVIEA